MWFVVDLLLGAAAAALFLAGVRALGRAERLIYQLGLLVAALVYVGLGLNARTPGELMVEIGGAASFLTVGLAGVFGSLWFLAIGWAAHGAWDLVLPAFADPSYMPAWYAPTCLGFDLLLALFLGALALGAIPNAPPPARFPFQREHQPTPSRRSIRGGGSTRAGN